MQPKECKIYVATCDGFTKVGVAENVAKRICGLQVGSPHTIRLVATLELGHLRSQEWETVAHRILRPWLIGGEWYRLPPLEAIRILSEARPDYGALFVMADMLAETSRDRPRKRGPHRRTDRSAQAGARP